MPTLGFKMRLALTCVSWNIANNNDWLKAHYGRNLNQIVECTLKEITPKLNQSTAQGWLDKVFAKQEWSEATVKAFLQNENRQAELSELFETVLPFHCLLDELKKALRSHQCDDQWLNGINILDLMKTPLGQDVCTNFIMGLTDHYRYLSSCNAILSGLVLPQPRAMIQTAAVEKICAIRPSFIALQEVCEEQRPEKEYLEAHRFQLLRNKMDSDAAVSIPLDTFNQMKLLDFTLDDNLLFAIEARFKNTITTNCIKNEFKHLQSACALAVVEKDGYKCAFLSMHATGFFEPSRQEEREGYMQMRLAEAYVNILCSDCDVIIWGGDFNASPPVYLTVNDQELQENNRFTYMLQQGYRVISTSAATSVHGKELDHFLVKIKKHLDMDYTIGFPEGDITSNSNTNPSDHLPIVMKLSIAPRSFVSRISSFFSSQ